MVPAVLGGRRWDDPSRMNGAQWNAWLEEGVLDPSEGTGPWIADWSADGEPVLGARRPFGRVTSASGA